MRLFGRPYYELIQSTAVYHINIFRCIIMVYVQIQYGYSWLNE